jgi:RHS repeat-associated protein
MQRIKYNYSFIFYILLLWPSLLPAQQNKPTTGAYPTSAKAIHNPGNYSAATPVNAIKTRVAKAPITNINVFDAADYTAVDEKNLYLDAAGRSVQVVVKKGSPLLKDIVAPREYDKMGRETYTYLPYVSVESNGAFKLNAFSELPVYYNTQYKDASGSLMLSANEKFFYNETQIEASPLGRIEKRMASGNSWVGSDVGVSMKYLINSKANDAVRIWNITNDAFTFQSNVDVAVNIPVTTGTYDDGMLTKTVLIDEQGHAVVEYKNKSGKVILNKVQQSNSVPADFSGYTGWLCTYYVYDDYGQLRFVLSPKAVNALNAQLGWSLTGQTQMINELCYRYEYDEFGRNVAKKVPGTGWVYAIYDKRNRIVFSQDANLHEQNRWQATLYDDLNRPATSGIINYAGNAAGLQLYVDGKIVLRSVTDFPIGHNFIPLIYTYYDHYDWSTRPFDGSYGSKMDAGANLNADPMPAQKSAFTKGLITGGKVRVLTDPNNLNSGGWIESVNYYDDKRRLIQTQATNYKGGLDIVTNLYDFSGNVLCNYIDHHLPGGMPAQTTVKTDMLYDNVGRLLKVWKTINDELDKKELISSSEYNEMGQRKRRELGRKRDGSAIDIGEALETQDYTYNVRGWLKGINKDYAIANGASNRWFGMELSYDWGFQQNQLNGNIAGVKWRSGGDGERRAYGFGYDPANRLLAGDFSQFDNSKYDENSRFDFNVLMGETGTNDGTAYDENGNIKKMQQWGLLNTNSTQIDNLTYHYNSNSNKLSSVDDDKPKSGLGDFSDNNTTGDDYGYDKNGNLVADRNKRMNGALGLDQSNGGAIEYNHLNLPWKIHVKKEDGTAKGTITYIYDAGGNKLEKITEDLSETGKTTTTKTTYVNGFAYESKVISPSDAERPDYNYVLKFFGHEDGRIVYDKGDPAATPDPIPASFNYEYFIKDHLGNIRMVLKEKETFQQYLATLENEKVAKESKLFNITSGRVDQLTTNEKSYLTNPGGNDKAYRVRGVEGEKTGLGLVLKVMAGDKLAINAESYYQLPAAGNSAGQVSQLVTTQLLDLFSGGLAGAGKAGVSGADLLNDAGLVADAGNFLTRSDRNVDATIPRAAVNYMIFNDQFQYQSGGIDKVDDGSGNGYKNHVLTNIEINRNGYVYIYVSNESDLKVLFDNLSVTHEQGRLVEETHYYPFGLTMAGISSKAIGPVQNKFQFNDGTEFESKEFSDGTGLDLYATEFRRYDPQLGRFWQIDELAELNTGLSPFVFANNNPILLNDPLGLFGDTTTLAEVIVTPSGQGIWGSVCNSCGFGAPNTELARLEYLKREDFPTVPRGEDWTSWEDWVYQLNKWNPGANLINGFSTFFYGEDTYGVKQNNVQGVIQVISAIPLTKVYSVLTAAESAVVNRTTATVVNTTTSGIVRSVGADVNNFGKVIQTGGHTLSNSTLKILGLTKEEGKIAIEGLKDANLLPPDFHGKITEFGHVLTREGGYVDYLFDYLP